MIPKLLILVIALLSSHSLAMNQDTVVCQSDFAWAQNEKGHNPCQVAAVVQGACNSNEWTVPALNSTHNSYTPPGYGATKENECSCSWAAYNLISACAACQGYSLNLKNWANITHGPCQKQGFLGDSYFPPSVPLSDQESIPSWAARNPSTWQIGVFSVDQAMAEAQKREPDLQPSGSKEPGLQPSGSNEEPKTPIEAIAGGVVGGVIMIVLGTFLAWFLFFRRKIQHDNSSRDYIQQDQSPQMTGPVLWPHQPPLPREQMISPFTLTGDQVSPTPPSNAHRKMNLGVSEMSNANPPVSRMAGPDEEQSRMSLSSSPPRQETLDPPPYTEELPTNFMHQVASPVRRDPASPGHGHSQATRHQRSQESALSWEGNLGQALLLIQGSITNMREITGIRRPSQTPNIPIA